MCELGINPDDFNPKLYYILKKRFTDSHNTCIHTHDFIAIMYMLSGSCVYNIEDRLYETQKGDIIVCNPGVRHGKIMSRNEEAVEFHVGFNNISIEGLPKNCLIPGDIPPVIRLSRYEHEFSRCCNEIIAEQEKNEPGCELMLKALVMKLLAIFLKAMGKERADTDESPFNFETYDKYNIVGTIVSFIEQYYMKDISLEKISRNMYLSPVYISRIFKEEMGDSPINYLIKVRLSRALELLDDPGMSVKAVARSVGYGDAYHFSKLFKKYYGSSPSKYREKVLKGSSKNA